MKNLIQTVSALFLSALVALFTVGCSGESPFNVNPDDPNNGGGGGGGGGGGQAAAPFSIAGKTLNWYNTLGQYETPYTFMSNGTFTFKTDMTFVGTPTYTYTTKNGSSQATIELSYKLRQTQYNITVNMSGRETITLNFADAISGNHTSDLTLLLTSTNMAPQTTNRTIKGKFTLK